MSKGKDIVDWEVIHLKDQFETIREKIEHHEKFGDLRKICAFNETEKTLKFKTEKIHPLCPKSNRIPALILFSNPHPVSVQNGMFLSGPSSRLFWRRLFDCDVFNPGSTLNSAIDNWSENTPKILSDYLLKGEYSKKVLLYFDCLEALPTNYYAHLNTLFQGKECRKLREKYLQDKGMGDLLRMSKERKITSWIVFSVEAYRHILRDKTIAKNAPKRIRKAVDNFLEEKALDRFWESLNDLKSDIFLNGLNITVYLSLIARAKNWKTSGTDGKRSFTVMLDRIFEEITHRNG